MKLLLALLMLLSFAIEQLYVASELRFASFPPLRDAGVKQVKTSGKIIATIEKGDFIFPRFSPDGNLLAYAKVIINDNVENTAIYLLNLKTHKIYSLLGAAAAKKYATYKTFVSEMKWLDAKRLKVTLSDGDVDETTIVFNVLTQHIISKKHSDYEIIEPQQKKQVSFKRSFISLSNEQVFGKIELVRNGDVAQSVKFKLGNQEPELLVHHRSSQRVFFSVKLFASYEQGDNLLFVTDGNQLLRLTDYDELYDADIDQQGRQIAFCFWNGDIRHIIVKELTDFD